MIDKDRAPGWSPPTLQGVTDQDAHRSFAPLGADELGPAAITASEERW